MRTIRVTGKGEIKIKPDMTRITVTLEGIYQNYDKTLQKSTEDTDSLKEILTGFGFERSDLKTLHFNVETEYESVKEHGVYKDRFVGYKYRHIMKVEFPSDNDRLGRILFALANSSVEPEFRISYTVSDPEAATNKQVCTTMESQSELRLFISVSRHFLDTFHQNKEKYQYLSGIKKKKKTTANPLYIRICSCFVAGPSGET